MTKEERQAATDIVWALWGAVNRGEFIAWFEQQQARTDIELKPEEECFRWFEERKAAAMAPEK